MAASQISGSRKTLFCHSPRRCSYLFRCPALLGSVYTSTFFPDLRLCSAVLCEFGTDRARNMEALLRKTTPRQVLHVLVRRKSETSHPENTSNSVSHSR